MDSTAVGIKVSHDFQCSDLCVEGIGILQVIDLEIVDHFPEEPGHPALRRLETGIVVDKGFVCSL